MGVASLQSCDGDSLLRDFDADSAGARDGPLFVLPLLRSAGYVAIFYSIPHTDWHTRRFHSDPLSDTVARRAIRYWDCRTDCGIRGRFADPNVGYNACPDGRALRNL